MNRFPYSIELSGAAEPINSTTHYHPEQVILDISHWNVAKKTIWAGDFHEPQLILGSPDIIPAMLCNFESLFLD